MAIELFYILLARLGGRRGGGSVAGSLIWAIEVRAAPNGIVLELLWYKNRHSGLALGILFTRNYNVLYFVAWQI